jgi:hypothetical protein
MTITDPATAPTSFTLGEPANGPPFTSNLAASLANDSANPNTTNSTNMFKSLAAPTTLEASEASTKPFTFTTTTNPPATNAAALKQFAQQMAAAQQAHGNSTATTNNVDLNLFAAQMLQQFSTSEGQAQLRQMQVRITEDGRVISPPSTTCVHVYVKNVTPRPPANLENIDGVLWNEFSLRLAPMTRQIKLTSFMMMAYGVLSAILCAVTVLVISPFAITGVMVGLSLCFFCLVYLAKNKWRKMNEEVKEIIAEFQPKFQIEGCGLEYFDMGLVVITRVPSSV